MARLEMALLPPPRHPNAPPCLSPHAQNEAMLSESVKMGTRRGDVSGKVEEQMRRAALLHARTGDFKKYCLLMVELNEWAQALAVAPAVSHEYWQALSKRYGEHLLGNSSELCVPPLLAAGCDAGKALFSPYLAPI